MCHAPSLRRGGGRGVIAGTSLFSASALLLVLRHFCYMGMHVSDQCYDTLASATTLLLRVQTCL